MDATAKMTGIERELISYIDIYLFIEKGMIGGTSYIGKDLVKPIINTWNRIMLTNQVKIRIWMKIIYMVGQWVNIYPRVVSMVK